MNKCKKCGTEFEGKFCPECGEPWHLEEEKICPKCKAVLKANAKFCSECGYSFETQSAPHPDAPSPAPVAHRPIMKEKPLTAGIQKGYAVASVLPAVLLGLFTVLLFLFFLAPVAVMPGGELMGESIPSMSYGNVYALSDYERVSLTETLTALIVFAALAAGAVLLLAVSRLFSKLRDKRFTIAGKRIFLRSLVTAAGYAMFFAIFLVSCILLGQIANKDGGLGIMKAGAAPILVLVFSLFGLLVALLCAFAGAHLRKIYPALVAAQEEKLAAAKPTAVEYWISWHKKLAIVFSVVLAVAVVVGVAVPVGLANRHNGIYYAYNGETETYDMTRYYKLKGGSWEDESGAKGGISFEGEKVTLTLNLPGGAEIFEGVLGEKEGTLVDDVLTIDGAVYAKEGHKHDMVNRECACGVKDNSSEGLAFKEYDDHWAITGIGTCTDTDIVISSWHEDKPVTAIENRAFQNCERLTSVTIGNGVISIGAQAFYGCKRLTGVTIGNGVTSIGSDAFEECTSLTNVTIPDSVTEIGDSAFNGCARLASIEIPDSVVSIATGAFLGCSGLEHIEVALENSVYRSEQDCVIERNTNTLILGCKNSIIPDSVTSIGRMAFCGCTGLTSITIPNSVTSIRSSAFDECRRLNDIQFKGTVEEWQAIEKGDGWNSNTGNYTVTCTDGKVSKSGKVTYF